MSRHAFTLTPFPGGPALLFGVDGSAARQGCRLTLAWRLTGEIAAVAWPGPAGVAERRDHLWQQTCCEFFWARPAAPGYWEANFSPAGHWQLYGFDDYRAGMRPERAIGPPATTASRSDEALTLAATLDLSPLCGPEEPLLLGVTMVVRTVDGATSYWALAHPAAQPDFHHRPGWTLAL